MSNSNLVTMTHLSPHMNSPRNNVIRKITPHHTAGTGSLEFYAQLFDRNESSANYVVSKDGSGVLLNVDEANRAWTSSSPANDNQAVTIEVVNDGGADTNWHVSDGAFNKLIELCVDICQRNGIPALVWTGDANGTLTTHNMFAATACPGPYLYSKMPELAAEVNKRLGIEPQPAPTPTPQPSTHTPNIYYRVKTQKHGWLPEVRNLEDYAGWEGSPIVDVMVRVDEGELWYQGHVCGGGWLGRISGYDENDFYRGYAGDDENPLDAIIIYYKTPANIVESQGYYKAKYSVNDYPWQYDDEKVQGQQDGYAGALGTPMTKLKVCLELAK